MHSTTQFSYFSINCENKNSGELTIFWKGDQLLSLRPNLSQKYFFFLPRWCKYFDKIKIIHFGKLDERKITFKS